MKWISVKKELPEFDENVLVFYTIEGKDQIHEYWDIGFLRSITKGKNFKSEEWLGKDYSPIDPTYWMPLPLSPCKLK
jgi:hypothetical protein